MSAYFNLPLVMSDLAGLELGHGGGGPPQSQSRSKNLRTRLESTRQVRNSGICQTLLFESQPQLATLQSFIGLFSSGFFAIRKKLRHSKFLKIQGSHFITAVELFPLPKKTHPSKIVSSAEYFCREVPRFRGNEN